MRRHWRSFRHGPVAAGATPDDAISSDAAETGSDLSVSRRSSLREGRAPYSVNMESDRYQELARRRDAAVRRILEYQRRTAEFRAAEDLVGALEVYAGSLPADDPAEDARIREWRGANLAAMRLLADCERLRNRSVTAAHDIRVTGEPGGERIADVSVLLSVDRARDESGREVRRPFRVVMDCLEATTRIRTEALGEHGWAACPAPTAEDKDEGATRTTGSRADLPIPNLYGITDPRVHQRTKFRPDRIDPYGLPTGVPTPAGSPHSSHGGESIGCQADPVSVFTEEDLRQALLGGQSPAPSEPGTMGPAGRDVRPDPPTVLAVTTREEEVDPRTGGSIVTGDGRKGKLRHRKAGSGQRERNTKDGDDGITAPGTPRRRPSGGGARPARSGSRQPSEGTTGSTERREAKERERSRSRSAPSGTPPAGAPAKRGAPADSDTSRDRRDPENGPADRATGTAHGPEDRPPTPGRSQEKQKQHDDIDCKSCK